MDEVPLRGEGGRVEFIGKGLNLRARYGIGNGGKVDRVIGFPGLSGRGALWAVRGPSPGADLGPVVHPLNPIDQRWTSRNSRKAGEVRCKAVNSVIEHVILPGVVGKDHVAAGPDPTVAIRSDRDTATRCEGVHGDALLIEKGTQWRECAAHTHAVSAQRTVTARGNRCEEVIVTGMIEEIAALEVVIDRDLLLRGWVGQEPIGR